MRTNQLCSFVIAALVTFASCSKHSAPVDNPQPGGTDSTQLTAFGSALVQIERADNELEWMASEMVTNWDEYANGKPFFGSASTTGQTTEEGKEILITFNSRAACSDGKMRSGKVLIELSNTFNDILVSPDGYEINDTAVSGTFSFERLRNAENRVQMNLTILNGKIGNGISFTGGRSRVKIAGDDTPLSEVDDVFEYATGNYYLTLTNQGLANATVASPVKETYSFRTQRGFVPAAGRIEYETANGKSNVLNFGNGTIAAKAYMEKAD